MKNNLSLPVIFSLILIGLSACSSSKEEVDVKPAEISKRAFIEIINDTIFVSDRHGMTLLNLRGDVISTFNDPFLGRIFGVTNHVLSLSYIYNASGTGSRVVNDKGGLYESIEGSSDVYFVDGEKVYKIDQSLQVEEIDVSALFDVNGTDIALRKALIVKGDMLASFNLNDGNVKTTLTIEENTFDIANSAIKEVSLSDDEELLFVRCIQELAVFEYTSQLTTHFPMGGDIRLFSINGEIYYRYVNGIYYIFNRASFSFDEVELHSGFQVINDVERYNGVDYVASDNSIWMLNPGAEPTKLYEFN